MGLGQPGFAGAIGRPPADGGNEGRRRKGTGGGRAGPGTKAVVAAPLTAPAAGFSIGRGAGGVVLQKAAVPTIAARPPVVTSSVINVRPVPVSGGTVPATAGPLAGAPPPASTHAPAEGVVVTGDGGMLGPGAPMGGAGTGRRPVERQRLAYLPQEPRYWGTEPDLVTSSLGTPADDDDRLTEQDFDAVPQRIAGIGARSETEHREEAATDWRML
jgi:hypothetical protein